MHGATTPFPPAASSAVAGRSYGILSTYPPTPCGLATFTAALTRGLEAIGAAVGVVRVGDGTLGVPDRAPYDATELESNVPASVTQATACLSDCDMAIVQHEYGLYGGSDGDEVLEILSGLTVPSIVVAHTVLLDPTEHQRQVLEAVADEASVVVVMTHAAQERLCDRFDVDPSKVVTIPHGAATPPPRTPVDGSAGPMLLTWGLIGQGKGIEWAIDAMVLLRDLDPMPIYIVAGRTHPKVLARQGDVYRESLIERVARNNLGDVVQFDNSYRDLSSLHELIQSVDLVVLPYDSHDQATSGVLVDALAAGLPVVATAFPHARELLTSGAGSVVGHEDPVALAEALRNVLTLPELLDGMAAEARAIASSLSWLTVATEYQRVSLSLLESVMVDA